MSSEHPTAVELDHVSFAYDPAAPPVLDDVSLRVEPRDFLGVIGPNGGGKTTLLKVILGLLRPQRGSVRVFGQPPAKARRRIGYVPQHARIDGAAPANVLDVVLMGRLALSSWGPRFRRTDIDAAMRALQRTDAADLAERGMAQLSGGQRQRVLIARALAADAELLMLDEPTSSVDAEAERALTDLLHRLNETLPIVIVSHDIAYVSSHLKRVACLNRRLTVHRAEEITDETVAAMYGKGRVVHHTDNCPLADPGCDTHPAPHAATNARDESRN